MSVAIQENLQRHQFQMMTMSSIVQKIQQMQIVIQNQQNVIDKLTKETNQKIDERNNKLEEKVEVIEQIVKNNKTNQKEKDCVKKCQSLEKDFIILNKKLQTIEEGLLQIKSQRELQQSNIIHNSSDTKVITNTKLKGFADPEKF
jgi:hypothetical protein